jgi:hypothetical protein
LRLFLARAVLKGSDAEGAVLLLLAARDAHLAATLGSGAPVPAPVEAPCCSICLEPYSATAGVVPRMLVTCGHDFCEACLDKMLRCVDSPVASFTGSVRRGCTLINPDCTTQHSIQITRENPPNASYQTDGLS